MIEIKHGGSCKLGHSPWGRGEIPETMPIQDLRGHGEGRTSWFCMLGRVCVSVAGECRRPKRSYSEHTCKSEIELYKYCLYLDILGRTFCYFANPEICVHAMPGHDTQGSDTRRIRTRTSFWVVRSVRPRRPGVEPLALTAPPFGRHDATQTIPLMNRPWLELLVYSLRKWPRKSPQRGDHHWKSIRRVSLLVVSSNYQSNLDMIWHNSILIRSSFNLRLISLQFRFKSRLVLFWAKL
jgi:hypothetical protein